MTEKDYHYYTRMERREMESKRKTVKRVVFVLAICVVILLGLFGTFIYDFIYGNEITFSRERKLPIAFSKVNILIIGYDSELNGKPRSDTMMLASFDLKEKAVGIVSIPRDTRVKIEGHRNYTKINSAFSEGGPEMAMKAVEDLLNVPVEYYVATNFDGFEAMIDSLGGLTIDVEEDMHYDDNAGGLHIHLNKGRQKLNGEKAIGYVRYRDHTYADLGRIDRQQKFINQAMDQLLTPRLILRMPKLIGSFDESIQSNMSFGDMVALAKVVKDVKKENIKMARIPGSGEYIGAISYFLHDPEKTQQLVRDLIASKEYVSNGKYRVAILNGSGRSGIASQVATRLKEYGYNVDKTSNADRYDYSHTLVVSTKEATPEIKSLGKLLKAKVIPVANTSYARDELSRSYDVLVILGRDF